MSEAFDVNKYWLERGLSYIREGFPEAFHRLQEQFLVDILGACRIPMTQVLELGCGFGRITKLLATAFPAAQITALDLSPAQLEQARLQCSDHANVRFAQYDFYDRAPLPGSGYDAVIAIEVFLHHPRPVVRGLFEKLSRVAQYLVNIDWSEEWPWKTPEHVWVHDYASLYAEAGLQSAMFELPEKVAGLQQKLFIASRLLSPAVLHAEQERRPARSAGNTPATTTGGPLASDLPEAALWPQQLDLAIREIRQTIPAGSTFILVNDDQWGNEQAALSDYKVIPFLERDGEYWGPPADDRTALGELARLQRVGASHIVFAWSSFWWLDYYAGFYENLRSAHTLILHNERLLIFRLAA